MNILAWMMSLALLVLLLAEAVTFQRATVCRQEAWLKSTELRTRALLTSPTEKEKGWHMSCKILLTREKTLVTWRKLPSLSKKKFILELEGKL